MEKPQWHVLSSTPAIDSPYLRIRRDVIELPDGTVLPEYYVRESRGFAMVFAITDTNDVVMVHEYRYGIDAVLLEFPAGTLDQNEEPLLAAQRELREETGYTAPRWEKLFAVASEPSRSSALMHGYLALDARKTHATEHDASEVIELALRPLADVPALVRERRISSVASIAIAYAALERLHDLRPL